MFFITRCFTESTVPDPLKDTIAQVSKEVGVKATGEQTCFIRKGLDVYKNPDFVDGERAAISYITTGTLDRDGDIVCPEGIDVSYFMKHPVVLFGHKYNEMPVGRAAWLKLDKSNTGIIAKTIYANTPQGDLIYNYRKEGFPLATSIGFIPTSVISFKDVGRKEEFEKEVAKAVTMGWVSEGEKHRVRNIIKKSILLEFSDVAVPANPEALQVACSKGLITKQEFEEETYKIDDVVTEDTEYIIEESEEISKTLIVFSASPINESSWDGEQARKNLAKWASSDGSGDKEKIDWKKYGMGFTYKTGKGESFGDYHLPHHDVVMDKFVVVWRGVSAAMSALMGARNAGVPNEYRKGVYSHLAKHYKQFKKEPPTMKDFEEEVKTNTPPNNTESIITKVLDSKGNPSVSDIITAIESVVIGKMQEFYKDVEFIDYVSVIDLYPVNYPNGSFVCKCYFRGGVVKTAQHEYTYDPIIKRVEVLDGVDVSLIWEVKKSNFEKRIYSLGEEKYLDGLSVEQIKKLPDLPYHTRSAWIEGDTKYFVTFSDKGVLFQGASIKTDDISKEVFDELERYKNTRINIAEKCFGNFSSVVSKTKEGWDVLYKRWMEFFLTALPGQECIKEFCERENVLYKGITSQESFVCKNEKELTKEQVVSLVAEVVKENNKVTSGLLTETLGKLLGRVQI